MLIDSPMWHTTEEFNSFLRVEGVGLKFLDSLDVIVSNGFPKWRPTCWSVRQCFVFSWPELVWLTQYLGLLLECT